VGVGYDVDGLMKAFINSSAHYRNIVDPDFNYIGVGVSYGADGRMYTTHDFMYLPDGGDAPADSAPTPTASESHRRSAPDPEPPPAADPPPEAPLPPPADPVRVHVMLAALRTVSG
jgi:hypothetical protein